MSAANAGSPSAQSHDAAGVILCELPSPTAIFERLPPHQRSQPLDFVEKPRLVVEEFELRERRRGNAVSLSLDDRLMPFRLAVAARC